MSEILRLDAVSRHFSGLRALRAVTLGINRGEVLGLIGPNGAGKTTLVNTICGVTPASSGRVTFMGQDITGIKTYQAARRGEMSVAEWIQRVLTDKPRNDRPEDKNRLMPQMIAYSATHPEFGKAWRARVMEVPKLRLKRILEQAMRDGRLPETLDISICYALLIGPLMFLHIFGSDYEHLSLGNAAAETFCRAYEIR